MKIGAWQIVGLIGLITGCAGFFPDIPGHFYEFQLTEAPPATICSDLSSYLASKFVLQIDEVLQPPPGQCIAIMESANHSPHVEVDLGSAMRERTVELGIEQRGFGRAIEPSKETDELAVQIAEAIHEKLPGDCLIFCVMSHTLSDRARSGYGEERYTGISQGAFGSTVSWS